KLSVGGLDALQQRTSPDLARGPGRGQAFGHYLANHQVPHVEQVTVALERPNVDLAQPAAACIHTRSQCLRPDARRYAGDAGTSAGAGSTVTGAGNGRPAESFVGERPCRRFSSVAVRGLATQ